MKIFISQNSEKQIVSCSETRAQFRETARHRLKQKPSEIFLLVEFPEF